MSYETAPATTLLATNCAACSRPLVDATSVETGMGPECRRRHGYTRPDVEVDAANVIVIAQLTKLLPEVYEAVVRAAQDTGSTRKVANILVHRIACEQDGAHVLCMINALRCVGFYKLADRLTSRVATITIEIDGSELVIKAPYSETAVDVLRRVPGRRWDREAKVNRFAFDPERPETKRPIFAALVRAYAGAVAFGPKGLFLLA